jgi:hypothetical protein
MTPPVLSNCDDFDLSDFFTQAARKVQGEARARGVTLLFDYEGPLVWVHAPRGALRALLDQALRHSVTLAPRGGHVFLRANVDCTLQAVCSIDAHIVGNNVDTRQAIEPQALERIAGVAWSVQPSSPQQEAMAQGYSEAANTNLFVHAVPMDGTVVRLQTQVQAVELNDDLAAVDARGARAWLIAHPSFAHEALARRLQRLGWTTTLFPNVSTTPRSR